MIKTKPNCFIAMRFGETDTDAIYEKYIEPTVLRLGLRPIRIDKVEHNKNIDDKIISELNMADLAIVDLTYARPSVYYEAGYAERKIPVIYTCRRDHFSNIEDTLRVHFDLEHKNIIDWVDVDDVNFPIRLESRIKHLIESMVKNTLSELQKFLVELKSSLSNPDHIFNRIKSFHELSFSTRPIEENDPYYEEIIKQRSESFKQYFDLLKFEKSDSRIFYNLVIELFASVQDEIKYLKDQLKISRFGHRIFLAFILKDLYALHLKISQELYQRPSPEYQNIYHTINNDIDDLISIIRSQ